MTGSRRAACWQPHSLWGVNFLASSPTGYVVVEQVLAAGRIGIEAGDGVGAEGGPEQEEVVPGSAVHGVVAAVAPEEVVGGVADELVAVAAAGHVGVSFRAPMM